MKKPKIKPVPPKKTPMCGYIDISQRVSMPIRDMYRDGLIVFIVDVYGWERSDVALIPGGSAPMLAAVERLGLDTNRYQATIWDISS